MRQHLGVWGVSPSGSPEGSALWCPPHRRPLRRGAPAAQAAKAAGLPEEKTFLQRKLEREIDALYARLAVDLRKENARLREELENLRREKGE